MKTKQEITKKLKEAKQLLHEINLIIHNKENGVEPSEIDYKFKWFILDMHSDILPVSHWYNRMAINKEVEKALQWVLK